MGGWVGSCQITKSLPNQDNSIQNILEIFGNFYLNHLSPLQGFTVYFMGLQRLEGLPSFVMHG